MLKTEKLYAIEYTGLLIAFLGAMIKCSYKILGIALVILGAVIFIPFSIIRIKRLLKKK